MKDKTDFTLFPLPKKFAPKSHHYAERVHIPPSRSTIGHLVQSESHVRVAVVAAEIVLESKGKKKHKIDDVLFSILWKNNRPSTNGLVVRRSEWISQPQRNAYAYTTKIISSSATQKPKKLSIIFRLKSH